MGGLYVCVAGCAACRREKKNGLSNETFVLAKPRLSWYDTADVLLTIYYS